MLLLLAAIGCLLLQLPSTHAQLLLLPSSSLQDPTLRNTYSCTPPSSESLNLTPCSNHGTCYLLFDNSSTSYSQFLNTSIASPLPWDSLSIDYFGIDLSSDLPIAVCACDDGWTGRGDWISHYGKDGNTCHLNELAVTALFSVYACVFFSLFLFCLYKLYLWRSWCISVDQQQSAKKKAANTEVTPASPPKPIRQFLVSPCSHVKSLSTTPEISDHQPTIKITYTLPPISKTEPLPPLLPSLNTRPFSPSLIQTPMHALVTRPSKTMEQRQVMWTRMKMISFTHPLVTAIICIFALCFIIGRLTTGIVLAKSHVWIFFIMGFFVGYMIAVNAAVVNTVRLSVNITRDSTNHESLAAIMRRVRTTAVLLTFISLLTWCLLPVLYYYPNDQDYIIAVIFIAGNAPYSLAGVAHALYTKKIKTVLMAGMNNLNAQQQQARLTSLNTLTEHGKVVRIVTVLSTVGNTFAAVWPPLRQYSQYILFLQWLAPLIICTVRLLIISTPKKVGVAANGNGNNGVAGVAPVQYT